MRILLCVVSASCLLGCTRLDEPPQSPPPTTTGAAPHPALLPFGQPAPPAAQPAPRDDKGIIGKMTARVVNYQQAVQENPRLKVVENKAQGNDPLSFAASAYVSARSRATLLNFQHQLRIMRELNEGRNLSYEQVMDLMRTTGLQLAELYPWQVYAYNEQTGELLVLEDAEEKAERYRRAGIPVEP